MFNMGRVECSLKKKYSNKLSLIFILWSRYVIFLVLIAQSVVGYVFDGQDLNNGTNWMKQTTLQEKRMGRNTRSCSDIITGSSLLHLPGVVWVFEIQQICKRQMSQW